jgi:Asp/Glu/hydantoin racemase
MSAAKMNKNKESIFSMRNTAKKMNNYKESIFSARNVFKNMNKRKESIFVPQNAAPQHTSHKANNIRFQKNAIPPTC